MFSRLRKEEGVFCKARNRLLVMCTLISMTEFRDTYWRAVTQSFSINWYKTTLAIQLSAVVATTL